MKHAVLASILVSVVFGMLSSCHANTHTDNANTLVSGEIVHIQDEPYTYQGDFVFKEGSHAVVTLFYSLSSGGDAPVERIAETRIDEVSSFPIAYRLEGNPETAFSQQGDYFLQVEVLAGAGDERYVGDLINEVQTPVSPGARVRVQVTGLEHCDDPNAGGFCITEERP